jgi:predicted lipoprotein with Yx(FWY)xxD motif
MRVHRTTMAVIALSVAAIAGGITVAATAGSSTPNTPTAAAPAKSPAPLASTPAHTAPVLSPTVTLHTASATVGGATETILVDGKNLPLYFYRPDTATESMVSGQLAALWPPLVASMPIAAGVSGTLKAVNTSNGQQVTYNGHFLYTFVEDSPGHVTGQGVQNFFVATPGITAAPNGSASGGTTPAQAPVGHGYGY